MSEVDDLKNTQSKMIEKIMSVLLTIALGLSTFALKEGYQAQMQITEMKVQISQIDKKITSLERTPSDITLISYKFDSLSKEMSEIKIQLKEMKTLLEKK